MDTERLREAGWRVVRLWEHCPVDEAVAIVERELTLAESAPSSGSAEC